MFKKKFLLASVGKEERTQNEDNGERRKHFGWARLPKNINVIHSSPSKKEERNLVFLTKRIP